MQGAIITEGGEMFKALSQFASLIWRNVFYQEDEEEENKNDSLVDGQSSENSDCVRHQDQQDVLLTALVDLQEKNEESETIQLTGKVSHIYTGHGMIDGEIYFATDSVINTSDNKKPVRSGDKVNVVAKKQFGGGWKAESVTVVESTWIDDGDELAPIVPTGDVGKVTKFEDGEGMINKTISFNLSHCKEGYHPHVGDWVSVELKVDACNDNISKSTKSNEEEWNATESGDFIMFAAKVAPLREWTFAGGISAAMPGHGYIDGEVFYTADVCLNGYRPRKFDVVKVTAIESTQRNCRWRAVSVVPTSSDSSAFKSRNRPAQKSTMGRGRGFVVSGQKPQFAGRKHKLSIPNNLPHYPIPEDLQRCIIDQEELTVCAPHLAQRLSMDNYIEKMDTLLHLEEIQMDLDIQKFNLRRVCLQSAGEYLRLEVPGLAEGRPSLLVGDAVILSCPLDPDQPQYEGIVHGIHNDAILLKFNPEFHSSYVGEDYNVAFTYNRTTSRRCHQAVHFAATKLGETVLFPKEVTLKPAQVDLTARTVRRVSKEQHDGSLRSATPQHTTTEPGRHYVPDIDPAIQDAISFYNPLLNDAQKAAVIQIVLGHGRALPYIIFGPPGTGKTITMVEAILQVFTCIPGSRLIVCTPSNSAADLLTERLHCSGAIKMCDMVRLNAYNRSQDNISESILGYCSTGEKLDVLCHYRIVVATCSAAGLLYTANLRAGHFTHAFVDEAGQATEPECLIPAGLVAGGDGQCPPFGTKSYAKPESDSLIGDPKQLGPVLMSPFAKMYGLEMSFLERLMERAPYQHNSRLYGDQRGFQSTLVTMLVNNYRSHASILSLPSELFYFGRLQECASHELTHTMVNLSVLPREGIPLLFQGVRGEDMREGDSPSWFNPNEMVEVVKYLQILQCLRPPMSPDDIGVITPYRKQVEKIRLMMDRLGIPRVKTGSVEEFQGQERQAIIISTVRSNERLVNSDIRHVLGFLSNPKRFNVSITRAQALLIVVGNPHVLIKDEHWQKFIIMCIKQGCYTGCELPETLKKLQQDTELLADNQQVTEQSADNQQVTEQSADNQQVTEQPADNQQHSEQPADNQQVTEQPADNQQHSEQPADNQQHTEQPADSQQYSEQPADNQQHSEQPADSQQHSEQPADSQQHSEQPADSQQHSEQPSDNLT